MTHRFAPGPIGSVGCWHSTGRCGSLDTEGEHEDADLDALRAELDKARSGWADTILERDRFRNEAADAAMLTQSLNASLDALKAIAVRMLKWLGCRLPADEFRTITAAARALGLLSPGEE